MTRPMHQDAAAAAVLRRTIMVLLLLLLMICLSSFPSVTSECPDKCICGEAYVSCRDKRLDRIPDRIHPATKELDLSFNEIRDIEPLAHLRELRKLNLKSNNISDIEPLAHLRELKFLDWSFNKIRDIEQLAHLTELQYLYLRYNEIRDIKPLAHLTELQYLDLSFNEIRDIEPLAHLTELKILYLTYNKIKDIEPLAHLTELQYLYLRYNTISDVEPLAHLRELQILMLEYNPLTCDCNILSFVNALKKSYPQQDVFKYSDPSCHFPVDKREKSLKEITENDFNCTFPDVIVVPENKTVSVGEQLQLSCKTVGDPEPSITWTKDDIDLELGQRVQVFQNNTLIISKVERTDGGQYKCVAFNSFGRKSFEAMVIVNESPDVIVVPENKTVSVGEQLQLSCKAVGHPKPFITWSKDDIDLELGQRVQVFQNNTLIISKVERTDGGQYKCVAFNFFGRKSFEAMVIVNDLAENGCNTMFGVIPGFFFIIIILANCLLYNDIF